VVALRFPLVRPHSESQPILAELSADPASMMRTGWSYLTAEDAAQAVLAGLTVPLAGANVIGLSTADTLLPVDTAQLLPTYAPDMLCRKTFHGREGWWTRRVPDDSLALLRVSPYIIGRRSVVTFAAPRTSQTRRCHDWLPGPPLGAGTQLLSGCSAVRDRRTRY
jgi:hypothetical protein